MSTAGIRHARPRWTLDAPLDDFVIVLHEELLAEERGKLARWGPIWKFFPSWGVDEQARDLVRTIHREVTGDRVTDLDDEGLAAWLDSAFLAGRIVLLHFPKEFPLLQQEELEEPLKDLDGGETDQPDTTDPCTQKVFAPVQVSETADEVITNPPPDPAYDPWRNLHANWPVRYTVTVNRAKNEVRAKVKIKVTGTISDAQKAAWKSAVESAWNDKVKIVAPDPACPSFSGNYDVLVEIEYVTSGQDYDVESMAPTADPGGGTHGAGGTMNMAQWGREDTHDVRHEFGHMLGNVEEYFTTNGHDYSDGGKKAGFRDPDGGIMNNPDNDPLPNNYEIIRKYAQKAMGGITCTLRER